MVALLLFLAPLACLGGGRCLVHTSGAGHALRIDATTGRPVELSWSRGGGERLFRVYQGEISPTTGARTKP